VAAPTEAECQDQIRRIIEILEDTDNFANANAANFLADYDALVPLLKSDYAADILTPLDEYRSRIAGLLRSGAALLQGGLRTYAKQLGVPERDAGGILTRIYERFHAANLRVKSRGFSFGTPSAGGGNSGDGTLYRLNVDENNYAIESQTADAKTVKCIQDRHSGAPVHREIFEIRGAQRSRDALKLEGSGLVGFLRALSARDSEAFLTNPSFDSFGGTTTAPTSIPGWTPTTSISNFAMDTTNYYRADQGVTAPAALKITANDGLTQLFSTQNAVFDFLTPYYCQVAWNRQVGAGDGTLTLTLGNVTASVALVAQTGWNVLKIPLGPGNWFKNFNKQSMALKIELASRTTGYVLVDDVVLAPMQSFDGGWYALVGGSTPFLRDDVFTFSDTETGAIIQKWLWRTYQRYLPSATGGAVTWTDPT
jgi:hypothetical protein